MVVLLFLTAFPIKTFRHLTQTIQLAHLSSTTSIFMALSYAVTHQSGRASVCSEGSRQLHMLNQRWGRH